MNIKNNQILFISQGVIGKYLSRFAVGLFDKLANDNTEYNFIYKLHPGEYDTWRDNYPELVNADKNPNFTVIDNSKTPLYKLFAESKYQVGAFSTAIYEGLQFDCVSFIVDLPGVEYLDILIDKYGYKELNDSNDIRSVMFVDERHPEYTVVVEVDYSKEVINYYKFDNVVDNEETEDNNETSENDESTENDETSENIEDSVTDENIDNNVIDESVENDKDDINVLQ